MSVDHDRRFGTKVGDLMFCMLTQDTEYDGHAQMVLGSLNPQYPSVNGRYEFGIIFNGARRRVSIFSPFPYYTSNISLTDS